MESNKLSKKKQKKFKNVLVLTDKCYWPVASESDSLDINKKLRICLEPVKIDIPRAPWFILRSLSTEERRIKNREVLLKQKPEVIEAYNRALNLRKCLYIGVNWICKGMEDRSVSACLLDADVSPRLLVTHVAELARAINVPVISIHNLKTTIKSVLGFSSLAIGFKKDIEQDTCSIFYDILLTAKELAKSTRCSQEVASDTRSMGFSRQKSTTQAAINDSKLIKEQKREKIISKNEKKPSSEDIMSLVNSVYLYRHSEDVRIFKPEVTELNTTDNLKVLDSNEECIQLKSSDDEEMENLVSDGMRYYKPLVVKQIQSNPKKKKTKFNNKKKKSNTKV